MTKRVFFQETATSLVGFYAKTYKWWTSRKSYRKCPPYNQSKFIRWIVHLSTLLFVEQQAQQLSIPNSCITFDQPLFIKAFEISKSKNINIVIHLRGFHLLVSFLGGTGTIMEGCGSSTTRETIYAPNSVVHLLAGKAYARALRCHLLTETSLQQILFNKVIADEEKITRWLK